MPCVMYASLNHGKEEVPLSIAIWISRCGTCSFQSVHDEQHIHVLYDMCKMQCTLKSLCTNNLEATALEQRFSLHVRVILCHVRLKLDAYTCILDFVTTFHISLS